MQLLDAPPLRVVGADVLHRSRDEAAEQRHELDLLVRERVGVEARDREHPDRTRADEQRSEDPAVEPERDEQAILVVRAVGEIAAHDRLAGENLLERRAREPADGPGRQDFVRADAGRRDRRRRVVLDEDDRDAVERHDLLQLLDERAERVLDLERRAERARATVRRLERVDVVAELVSQRLRLLCAREPELRLLVQAAHEPADDETREQQHADRERDAVGGEAGRAEVLRAEVLAVSEHAE